MTSTLLFERETVYNLPPSATLICLRFRCGQYVRKISVCSVFYKNVIKLINWGIRGIRDWLLKYHFWKYLTNQTTIFRVLCKYHWQPLFSAQTTSRFPVSKVDKAGSDVVCVYGEHRYSTLDYRSIKSPRCPCSEYFERCLLTFNLRGRGRWRRLLIYM